MSHPLRTQLVKALEALTELVESDVRSLAGTAFVSPQQPLAELSPCLWQIRRGDYSRLLYTWLLVAPNGQICRLAKANGWEARYEELLPSIVESFAALHAIRYAGTEIRVELGDHVQLRGVFGRAKGRVTYLPGQPRHNPELDFGGICRIGIGTEKGAFTAVHVDPHSLEVKESVTFVSRDAKNVPSAPSDEELRG